MFEEICQLSFALKYKPRDEASAPKFCWCIDESSRSRAAKTALYQNRTHGACLGFFEALFCEKGLGKGIFYTGDIDSVIRQQSAIMTDGARADKSCNTFGFVNYCLELAC